MGDAVTARLPSVETRERTLAALLVALLVTYALGILAEGVAPAVHGAGVVAVHLAVVVGFLFPVAVLGHNVVGWLRGGSARRRALETATAIVTVGSITAAFWQASAPFSRVFLAVAAGGSLLLSVLVVR